MRYRHLRWVLVVVLAGSWLSCGKRKDRRDKRASAIRIGPYKLPHGTKLPTGRPAASLFDAVDVAIGPAEIFVRGRRVMKLVEGKARLADKRDGPDGFFLDPLFVQLKKEAERLKAAERAGGKRFEGRMILLMHQGHSYRLLAEVLYTSNQAEFKSFQLAYRLADGGLSAVSIDTPRAGCRLGRGKGYLLTTTKVTVVKGPQGARAGRVVAALSRQLALQPLWWGSSMAEFRRQTGSAGQPPLLKKGSKEYRRVLKELTNLDLSDDQNKGAGPPTRPQPRPKAARPKPKPRPALRSVTLGKASAVPSQAFPCRRHPHGGGQGAIGVLVSIGPQGKVQKIAVTGAGTQMLSCCLLPWLSRLSFDPREVTTGTYSFTVRGSSGKIPPASSLRPLPRQVPTCSWDPLNLTVVAMSKGYYVKSTFGSECPVGVDSDTRLCFPLAQSKKANVIQALGRHLWHLFAKKYAHPRWWSYDPLERTQVILIPEPGARYGEVMALIQALREAPLVKAAAPCRKSFDPKTRKWRVVPRSHLRCMYHSITLALGSS